MAGIKLFREACKGIEDCGLCIYICPKGLFQSSGQINKTGYIPPKLSDESDCILCKNCMIYCPDFAIVVEGEEKQLEENEVMDG